MRDTERKIIVESCDKAEKILSQDVGEDEFFYQFMAAQFLDIFKKAVTNADLTVSNSALRNAIDQTFHLSSHEARLQGKFPIVWQGLVALQPAAGQLNREFF